MEGAPRGGAVRFLILAGRGARRLWLVAALACGLLLVDLVRVLVLGGPGLLRDLGLRD